MSESAFTSTRPTVYVDGEESPEIGDALTAMVVNLPLNGMAHTELNLTNWGLNEGEQDPDFTFQGIGLGKRIEIFMGEGSEYVHLFDGEVTGVEERYGEGAPQLVLLLQDKLHHMARKRDSRAFENQSPDDIVQTIAGEFGLSADVNISSVASTYHQINESYLAFLLRLLGRFDIALRLDGDTLRARIEEADAEPVVLNPQDNALRVRLIADLNHQPNAAHVMGYNAINGQSVDGSVSALSIPPSGTAAVDILGELGWPGEEVIPQPFARSQGEADAYAQGHFNRQAKRFVCGDIYCLGEGVLKSGREIELEGVSERLQGIYQVVHCVHRFDGENGYETHVKVNRADWGG